MFKQAWFNKIVKVYNGKALASFWELRAFSMISIVFNDKIVFNNC